MLNLFNVLEKNLADLEDRLRLPELHPYEEFCVDALLRLTSLNSKDQIGYIEQRFQELIILLAQIATRFPHEKDPITALIESLQVGLCRMNEFRHERFDWRLFRPDEMRFSLIDFLKTTAKISGYRFKVCFEPDDLTADGYYFDIQIEFPDSGFMAPPVVLDLMRDLVANARKYSPPGTRIGIRLNPTENNGLMLTVSDQGIGIPAKEITRVVEFGYRATNVAHRRTMGSGIGLTKAYLICKRFKGRFHIASEVGSGTTISASLLPDNPV